MEILTVYKSQEDFEFNKVERVIPFRICHFRSHIKAEDYCKNDKRNLPRHGSTLTLPTGGATQVIYINGEGKVNIVTAHCSVSDRFSRVKGIKTCLEKFVARNYPESRIVAFFRPDSDNVDFAIILGPALNDNK